MDFPPPYRESIIHIIAAPQCFERICGGLSISGVCTPGCSARAQRPLASEPPRGVTVQSRTDGKNEYLFVLNFSPRTRTVDLGENAFLDLLRAEQVRNSLELDALAFRILQRLH